MSDVEELLTRTLRDPGRALPTPADPMPAIRQRARVQRRNTALGVAVVLAVVAATLLLPVTVGRFTRPAPVATDPPPAGSGLLEWPAAGPLAGDTRLVRDAAERWRDATGTIRLLWAGRVGADRVVLLQGSGADGTPTLAEVADRAGALTLVRAEPIRDPGVATVRLVDPAGSTRYTRLLVRPGADSIRLLFGSGVPVPVPPDRVVALDGDQGGLTIATLDRDGRVVGDGGAPPASLLSFPRGDLRLTTAVWDGGSVRPPSQDDYAGGVVLGSLLENGPWSAPVEVAAIEDDGGVDLRSGRQATPRFYELHREGRTYLGSTVWIDDKPYCAHLDDVTDSGGQPDALVLRCALPQDDSAMLWIYLHNGIRLSGLRVEAAHPGEKALTETYSLPLDRGTLMTVAALPTGPGLLHLEDDAGDPRPPFPLPAYRP